MSTDTVSEKQSQVLQSRRVEAGRRTYFLDVKQNDFGRVFLRVCESVPSDDGFKRNSIIVPDRYADAFLRCLEESIREMKSVPKPEPEVAQTATV